MTAALPPDLKLGIDFGKPDSEPIVKPQIEGVISSPEHKPPRILLLGNEKVGKTTFASQAPSPIMLPIKGEEGIDALSVSRFPTQQTFPQVLANLKKLTDAPHDFETVVIDSASALEPLIWQHVCEMHGVKSIEKVMNGYGKGYTEAASQWRELTNALDVLRERRHMACILIGHVKPKSVNDPLSDPYDAFVWDVQERASSLLYRWADSILFATRKAFSRKIEIGGKTITHATGDDSRVLYTRARPGHPGGGRGVYGQLPYELPLSWQAFEQALTSAMNPQPEK